MALKIGYKASAEQFAPRELVEYAVLAEKTGLDSVWVSDHLQPWRHQGGHAPFSLAWLSAVGERTERVQLGTSVLTATFRYNPAVVAHAFATLGVLYPGRIVLGVGTGEALNEVAVARITWPDFSERFARLREAVELIRQLWTRDRVTFDGRYYQTADVSIYDRPDEPVPIYIAAGGPVMARFAGRQGDGFICTSGKGMDLYIESLLPALRTGAEQEGRDISAVDKMIEIKLSWDPDSDVALDNTRFWAPLSLSPEQKAGFEDPVEMEKAADALPIEQVARRWIVASHPDDAIARIKRYTDAGFNHLVLHGPGHDQERFLRTLGEQVLPGLRDLG